MVERGRAHDKVESVVQIRKVLGGTSGEVQATVVARRGGNVDHRGSRVNPVELLGARAAAGYCPEQVAGAAAHVEHAVGIRKRAQGEVGSRRPESLAAPCSCDGGAEDGGGPSEYERAERCEDGECLPDLVARERAAGEDS
jgi:hypothetical protein